MLKRLKNYVTLLSSHRKVVRTYLISFTVISKKRIWLENCCCVWTDEQWGQMTKIWNIGVRMLLVLTATPKEWLNGKNSHIQVSYFNLWRSLIVACEWKKKLFNTFPNPELVSRWFSNYAFIWNEYCIKLDSASHVMLYPTWFDPDF